MVSILLAGLTLSLTGLAAVYAAVDAEYLSGVYLGGCMAVFGGLFALGGLIA